MAETFVKRGRLWDTVKAMLDLVEGSVGQQGEPGGAPGPLDSSGHIPTSQMPIDGLNYQGTWDANANSPTLAAAVGTVGDFYRVETAGTQDLGEGATAFEVGDHVIFEGGVWQKVGAGGVLSVNGDKGPDVILAPADIGAATAAQGAEADSAVQPGDLATVATSGAYGDLTGTPINRTSGTVQLTLAGEELSWPTDVQTGKIRLYDSTPGSANTFYGLGVQNGVQVYQVDSNTSKHVFQGVDGSDNATTIAELSHDGGVVSHVDLHMSEKKIINLGDPTNARDGVNLQTLDAAVGNTVFKAADESRASTTTLAADSDLAFSGLAAGTYEVEGVFMGVADNSTPNMKAGFVLSVAPGAPSTVVGVGNSVADGAETNNAHPVGTAPDGEFYPLTTDVFAASFKGVVVVASTSDLSFAWAQNTSDAGNATVMQGSWMRVTRIDA